MDSSASRDPAQGDLEFRILGPLEIARGTDVIEIAGRKQRALLAMLVINANHVVSTDRLIDSLWGETPPRTAATSLQNFVAYLRKALGPETIVTRTPGYLLDVDPGQIDAVRFERLLAEARAADVGARLELLRQALTLWRGGALPEFAYDAFAENQTARVEELRVAALVERTAAELELGLHADVVPELEALVAQHPLREVLRGQLMLALYRSGRQADALQAYQDARRALTDELGIEPSAEPRELHRSILGQEPALVGAASRRPLTTPDHYAEIVRAMVAGRLVPVLGAASLDAARPGGQNTNSSNIRAYPSRQAPNERPPRASLLRPWRRRDAGGTPELHVPRASTSISPAGLPAVSAISTRNIAASAATIATSTHGARNR